MIELVYQRYGRIKPRYASLLGEGKGGEAEKAALPPQGTAGRTDSLATKADLPAIASRFTCACGQCQDMNLAQCDCDHPRGAVEMKAFIEYEISQKHHTVAEIEKSVAYEYGHRIGE